MAPVTKEGRRRRRLSLLSRRVVEALTSRTRTARIQALLGGVAPASWLRVGSEQLYLSKLDVIERAIGAVCRRHCLFGADGEDFASTVRIHLIENDYGVLRAYQERSSLHTY